MKRYNVKFISCGETEAELSSAVIMTDNTRDAVETAREIVEKFGFGDCNIIVE